MAKFEGTDWKSAFVQTRSNVRELQPGTLFLYCKLELCYLFVAK